MKRSDAIGDAVFGLPSAWPQRHAVQPLMVSGWASDKGGSPTLPSSSLANPNRLVDAAG
jgi:hypothetical protein